MNSLMTGRHFFMPSCSATLAARRILLLFCGAATIIVQCDYPHNPVRQAQPVNTSPVVSANIYPVNINNQICNPSISQNTTWFPADMLWLNLGSMAVNVPSQWAALYTLAGAVPHDRLTIADTSNTVTWFMMKPAFIKGDMQDPEWSTHPDYIAFLGEESYNIWNGYIIRISDKAVLQFNQHGIEVNSTPHCWLPDSESAVTAPAVANDAVLFNSTFAACAKSAAMVSIETIQSFFGTRTVRIVFVKSNGTSDNVFYIDYGSVEPELTALARPASRGDWRLENPLISPDGNWVVYHCISPDLLSCEAYLQKLAEDAKPVLMSENAADPHWWKNPQSGRTGVLFCDVWQAIPTALDQIRTPDGSYGRTWFLSVDCSAINDNLPGALNFPDSPKLLVNLPFRGGLSRDGAFLATGYQYGYLYKF